MVDFVLSLIRRIVSLLQWTVLSNNITIDDKDGGAIINMMIALGQKRNVKVEDQLKVATQVFELSQAIGKLGPTCDKRPRPLMYALAPLPLVSAQCD